MATVCGARYNRPAPLFPTLLTCHYIKGHPAKDRHSWWTLKQQDACDLDAERYGIDLADVPKDVHVLLTNITDGRIDEYLEAILAVTHNRKRAVRGTAGFAREGE